MRMDENFNSKGIDGAASEELPTRGVCMRNNEMLVERDFSNCIAPLLGSCCELSESMMVLLRRLLQ